MHAPTLLIWPSTPDRPARYHTIYSWHVDNGAGTFEFNAPVELLRRGLDLCSSRGLRPGHRAPVVRHAGLCKAAGGKAGRWIDVIFMQRPLDAGDGTPPRETA